jgi:chemotaxis family two-component system sensor kinase Cph1
MTTNVEVDQESLDLDGCAQEPIHIPGAIQPHGCLLAFDPKTLVVSQASANAADFFGLSIDDLLNRSLTAILPAQAQGAVAAALSAPPPAEPFLLDMPARRLTSVLHKQDGIAVMEVEASAEADLYQQATLDRLIRRLAVVDDLEELAPAAVQIVRELTGFDRVVIYRFDDANHGQVIAEARADDMDPYLGLNFPESDIPRQARELYLRNWIRIIPDARYQPVPLVPALRPDTGLPLDLTHSFLRSVSPVHLQYLANMGLQASMSVSLIVAGRLWGLISCGHPMPRGVPARLRIACETVGRMLSLHISSLQTLDLQRKQAAKADTVRQLAEALRSAESHGVDGLPSQPALLLDVARADGAAVISGETVTCIGSCPDAATVLSLAQWVSERTDARGIYSTRQLGIDHPPWADCAGVASGLLAMLLPTPRRGAVLWFRPELVHTVDWGGNPNKPAEPGAPVPSGASAAGGRLGPRRSFELWKEVVRGRAAAWAPAELAAVQDLRRSAIEIDLHRQIKQEQAAVRARDELMAVVAHDLRTPMSVVVMQASVIQRLLARDATDPSPRLLASAQIIQRAGERMSTLLNDLLDLAKIDAGRFDIAATTQDAAHILQDAFELLHPICDARQQVLEPHPVADILVRADPERLFQVLANLVSNASKFSPDGALIHLRADRTMDNMCEFSVSDHGSGIAPDEVARIFDRYWQSGQPGRGGAGLGLYICRGIVEAHGGTIRVESRLGHGTTIYFTVPLDEKAAG